MGTTMSTFLLLGGTLVTGILSSLAANSARTKDWSKAKMMNGITAALAGILVLLTLFIVVKGHTGTGEITGIIEEMAIGVMLSFILLMIAMVIVTALSVFAAIDAGKENSNSFKLSVGAAIASFGSFILSLFLIIFLL